MSEKDLKGTFRRIKRGFLKKPSKNDLKLLRATVPKVKGVNPIDAILNETCGTCNERLVAVNVAADTRIGRMMCRNCKPAQIYTYVLTGGLFKRGRWEKRKIQVANKQGLLDILE